MKKQTLMKATVIIFSIWTMLSLTACEKKVNTQTMSQTQKTELTEITAVEGISFSVPSNDLAYAAQQMVQGEKTIDLSNGLEKASQNAMVVSSPTWYYQTDESNFYYAAKKIYNGISVNYLKAEDICAENVKTVLGFETCSIKEIQAIENEGLSALIGDVNFEVRDLNQNGVISYSGKVCLLQYQDKQYAILYGMGDGYYSAELLTNLINSIRYTGNASSLFTPLTNNTPVTVCNNALQVDTCPIIQYCGEDMFKCITDDMTITCLDSPTGNDMSPADIITFMQTYGETMDKFVITDKDGREWVCKMIYSGESGLSYYGATSFNKKIYIFNTTVSSIDSISTLKECLVALISSATTNVPLQNVTTEIVPEATTEVVTEAIPDATTEVIPEGEVEEGEVLE